MHTEKFPRFKGACQCPAQPYTLLKGRMPSMAATIPAPMPVSTKTDPNTPTKLLRPRHFSPIKDHLPTTCNGYTGPVPPKVVGNPCGLVAKTSKWSIGTPMTDGWYFTRLKDVTFPKAALSRVDMIDGSPEYSHLEWADTRDIFTEGEKEHHIMIEPPRSDFHHVSASLEQENAYRFVLDLEEDQTRCAFVRSYPDGTILIEYVGAFQDKITLHTSDQFRISAPFSCPKF